MNYLDDQNNNGDNYNYNYQPNLGTRPPAIRANARKNKVNYITRKGFILGLICCMLLTSALTIGGLSLLGAFNKNIFTGEGNSISATNYTLADATDTNKSIEEIVKMNENAVVEIQTEAVTTGSWITNYITQGAGSGIIIDSEGYILTCNHVVADARNIIVITKDGEQHKATLVGGDSISDVAVLKIAGSGYTAATYGNSDGLTIGDLAVAIGNPLGKLGGSASVGIISSLERDIVIEGKLMNLIQTDASINPGNSGGGLFDGEGNLIGVVVAKSIGEDVEGIGFAIPINDAAAIAKKLIEDGVGFDRAYIGVSVIDASSEIIARQYGFNETGIHVYDVFADEAKAAGFKAGDIIKKVEGVEVNSSKSLSEEINKHKPGDTVTITVLRNGEELELETVLIQAS